MSRVTVITGGPDYAHHFLGAQGTGITLAEQLREAGHEVDCTDDVDRAFLGAQGVDVLVVNALRWRMLAPQYAQWRDQWAFSPSTHARQALVDFVREGGGLVACHTAVICFDDWPQWGEVLGGSWVWGTSWHPAPAAISANLAGSGHPVLSGIDRLDLVDEVYGDLAVSPHVTVLATAPRHLDDPDQPVVWTHTYGRGRVVVNGFGHDVASLRLPQHRQLLLNAVDWCSPTSQETAA